MPTRQSFSRVSKRKLAAVLAGVGVFAIVSASAATLGGLETAAVGANSNAVVSPVENGVQLAWSTEYDRSAGAYVVAGAQIAALDDTETIPANATVQVTLTDAAQNALGEYVSIDGGATWSTTPTTAITAHDVAGASVVVNGGSVTAAVSEQR